MEFKIIIDLNSLFSEWKPIKTFRLFDAVGGAVPDWVQGLKRKDGFKITHELFDSMGHGKPDIFECKGRFGKFRFAAQRPNINGEISKIYEVYVDSSFTSNPEMCLAHAHDIESALLNFPPVRSEYKQIPLEEVVFWNKGSALRANELNTSS